MNTPTIILLAAAATFSLTACKTTRKLPEGVTPAANLAELRRAGDAELQARLAPEWIESATRIEAEAHTIYYVGTATPMRGAPAKPWAGKILGDVLILSPSQAITCTGGKVEVGPGDRIDVQGRNAMKMLFDEVAPWQHLLAP